MITFKLGNVIVVGWSIICHVMCVIISGDYVCVRVCVRVCVCACVCACVCDINSCTLPSGIILWLP